MANAYEEFIEAMKKRNKEEADKMETIKDISQDVLWLKGAITTKINEQFPIIQYGEGKVWSDKTDKGFAFSECYVNYIIAYAYACGRKDAESPYKERMESLEKALKDILSIADNEVGD